MIDSCCGCLIRCLCGLSCYEFCCESNDKWLITDEIRPGEYGAGHLYKKAKSSIIWSKRYFVLTRTKLLYYQTNERTESKLKGEIVIAGSKASISSRTSSRNHYYFQIEHRECGTREFYATSRQRMNQWINKINDMSLELNKTTVYGNLSKQGGGLTKTGFQSRWCIVVLNQLDYFEKSDDNQSKGSTNLKGATVKEIIIKGMPHCFELTASSSKKGTKKYVFSASDDLQKKKFMAAITEGASINTSLSVNSDIDNVITSPINSKKEIIERGSIEMNIIKPELTATTSPKNKCGYLEKKSPSMFAGFQKRHFRIENNKLNYYENETSNDLKGKISLLNASIELYGKTDIVITCGKTSRAFNLRAITYVEAQAWGEAINEWILFLNEKQIG